MNLTQLPKQSGKSPQQSLLPAQSRKYAQSVGVQMIGNILHRVNHLIDRQWKFKTTLSLFSNQKTTKNMNEINTMHFLEPYQIHQYKQYVSEPTPLMIDSLLRLSADVEKENLYKKMMSKLDRSPIKNQSEIKQVKENKNAQVFEKLPVQQEEEDGFTKQLRKMQEDKVKKQNKQGEIIVEKQTQKNKKDKKKEFQQKISYDYNGQQIKVRNDQKNTLVNSAVNSGINERPIKNKQCFDDPNPTKVQGNVVISKKMQAVGTSRRRDEVQFNLDKLFPEVSVKDGVKYTFQGRTVQHKKKMLTNLELKKSMSQRMLNKEEFERVKMFNGASLALDKNISKFDFNSSKIKEEGKKLKRSRVKLPILQKITVNNDDLKEKLITKDNQLKQETKAKENNPQDHTAVSLSNVDSFNLNYIRSGGSLPKSSSSLLLQTRQSLPKIPHTNTSKQGLWIPKNRQKIKEASRLFVLLRRKSDEKRRE